MLFTYQNYREGDGIEVGFSDMVMLVDGVQGMRIIQLKRELTNAANARGHFQMWEGGWRLQAQTNRAVRFPKQPVSYRQLHSNSCYSDIWHEILHKHIDLFVAFWSLLKAKINKIKPQISETYIT